MKPLLLLLALLFGLLEQGAVALSVADTQIIDEVKKGNWSALEQVRQFPADRAFPVYGEISLNDARSRW